MPNNSAVPTLSDGRVILTGHSEADVVPHLNGEDDGTARRFGWWPEYSTQAAVRAGFGRWEAEWRSDGPARAFAVRDAVRGWLVGGCELRVQPDGSGQVSYWANARHRRNDYAGRALRLLCSYAASIGITRLEAHVARDNQASRRVAMLAGFTEEGVFTGDGGQVMVRYVRVTR